MSGGYRSIMEVGEETKAWVAADFDLITFSGKDPGKPCHGDNRVGACSKQALWRWELVSEPCDHAREMWGDIFLCQMHREMAQVRWESWVKMVMDMIGYQKCGSLVSHKDLSNRGCTGTINNGGFFPIGGK